MKISQKIINIILTLSIVFSMFCMSATTKAATNDVNTFKSADFVKCGGYYFFCEYDSNEYITHIYRTKQNGEGKKIIGTVNNGDKLCTYKNKLYYSNDKGVYFYNPKTDKSTLFKKGDYQIVGICNKGVISYTYGKGLSLINFNKTVKKVASRDYSYLCSTNKYIFFYTVKQNGDKYKTEIKRYNLNKNKAEKASDFTIKNDYQIYLSVQDSHVFKKCIIFSFGIYEGTGLYYNGAVYKMSKKGTGVKKILNKSFDVLTPGKNCVYASLEPIYDYSMSECYKITANGKASKVKGTKGFKYSTSNNYYIYSKDSGNYLGYDMYARQISKGKGKKIFNAKSFIKENDPKNAYVLGKGLGAFGDTALISITVYSPEGGIGWRPKSLRNYKYLVNLKTNKKALLFAEEY